MVPNALTADLLTFDHVPPKSQGGRALVLTCRDCNSVAGHDLEGHLAKAEDVLDIARRTMRAPGRVRLESPEGALNVLVHMDPTGVRIYGLPGNNPPELQRAWEAGLDAAVTTGEQPQLTFKIVAEHHYRHKFARIGWLKSAYLAAFAALGYRYILLPLLASVREQIANPGQPSLDGFSVYLPVGERTERGIYIADEPIPSLMVRMGYHLIVLPNWDSPADFFSQLAAMQPTGGGPFHASYVKEIPWPMRMELALDLPDPVTE